MATKNNLGCIAAIIVLVPVCIVGWFVAPLILPVWRWSNLDFPGLAVTTKLPQSYLEKRYTFTLRYNSRGDHDPMPWQVMLCEPNWQVAEGQERFDETDLLVRVTLISDRTGEAPALLIAGVGSTIRDQFFKCEGWRLPPGTFGANGKRPVIVVDMSTWEKLGITKSLSLNGIVTDRHMENDDKLPEREDGYVPPRRELIE